MTTARVATTVRKIAAVRLWHSVDQDIATDVALRAWTAGADRVEGIDDPGKPPLSLTVAQVALDRLHDGRADPAVVFGDALADNGLRVERVDVRGSRDVVIVHAFDDREAWRIIRHLADATLASADTGLDVGQRWATVEAFDDRHSPSTWRVLIGPEDRSGKGR